VQIWHLRRDGVRDDDSPVAALGAFAGRFLDADLGHGAGHQHRFHLALLEQIVEIGVGEGAVAKFLDDRFSGFGVDLGDDVRAVERPDRVLIITLDALPATLRWRRMDRRPLPEQYRLWSSHEFGIVHGDPHLATGGEQRLVHGNRVTRLGHFQRRPDAHEIVLHAHHQQCRASKSIDRLPLLPGRVSQWASWTLDASLPQADPPHEREGSPSPCPPVVLV